MKINANYVGIRTENGNLVTCNGVELSKRTDLRNHTPTGFDWGNQGSEAAQLSLAIMADFCGDSMAMEVYDRFKTDIIASMGASRWTLKSEMLTEWVRKVLKEQKADAQPGHFI